MIGAAGYALLIAAFVALTAWLAERILASLRAPRRFVWIAALVLSIVVPAWNLVDALPDQSPFEIPAPPPVAPAAGVLKPTGANAAATSEPAPAASATSATSAANMIPWGASARSGGNSWRLLRRLWTRKLYRRLQIAFGIAWALLTAALLARLFLASRRLQERARPWPVCRIDGTEVRVSEDLGPAVLGILRPRIVVPRWFEQEPPARRALVLAHEREHLAAHDGRWLLAGALLVALFPWNLPLWWQWRRLRLAVEADCDARVLRRGEEPQAYGSALVEVAARTSPAPPGATGVFERQSQLERRLRIVLASPKRWWRYAAAPLYLLTVLSALAAATFPAPPVDAALGARNEARSQALTTLQERAQERSVTARLIANGSPDSLAAAAVFMVDGPGTLESPQMRARWRAGYMGPPIPANARERYGWLAEAAAKAPDRADLVMMELTYCKAWNPNCDLATLEAQLRRLDPENGAVWLDDLGAAVESHDPARIDAALAEIGSAKRVDSDGTRLVPVLYHALHDIGGVDATGAFDTGTQNAGSMLTLNFDPVAAISHLCGGRGPLDAVRTNACRGALRALEHGDNLLYVAVGSRGATRRWPADTAEGRAARSAFRRVHYLEHIAGRRPWPNPWYLVLGQTEYFKQLWMPMLRADTEYPREQDAWRAVMIASGVNPDPPPTWKDPFL